MRQPEPAERKRRHEIDENTRRNDMKIKKTTSLAVTAALLASGLGATLFAQAQHNAQTHQAGAAAPPKMGMTHEGMAAYHDKMMAEMKAADTKLDALAAKMNAAKGNAKVEAMAAVINEMVSQRKMMRGQMQMMHEQMMGGQGMMGGSGMMGKPNTKPTVKPDKHKQHH
jgi:hypothetical protein